MLLTPIYEQDFYPFSYGFRPGKSALQGVHELWHGCMRFPRMSSTPRQVVKELLVVLNQLVDELDGTFLESTVPRGPIDLRSPPTPEPGLKGSDQELVEGGRGDTAGFESRRKTMGQLYREGAPTDLLH